MAKEDKWIKVLSGKSKPNPKNKDEIEASYLREAIGSYEKKIGLDNPNPEFSFYRFEQLLKEKDQQKASTGFINKLKHYKWETVRLIAATATGIAIATLPTIQMATRSASDLLYSNVVSYLKSHSSTEVISKEIILEMNEPISESRLITESAISMGMTVIRSEKIEGNEKIQILIIKGFKKFDDKQAQYLKLKLNLEGRDEGNIKVLIRKNKH